MIQSTPQTANAIACLQIRDWRHLEELDGPVGLIDRKLPLAQSVPHGESENFCIKRLRVRTRRMFVTLTVVLALVRPALAETSDEFFACKAATSDTATICSAAIASGKLSGREIFTAYKLIGMDDLQRGKKNDALAAFDKMISAAPTDPNVILSRALVYSNLIIVQRDDINLQHEFIRRAADDWNTVQSLAPNTPDLYMIRASSLISWIQSRVVTIAGDDQALERVADDIARLIVMNDKNPNAYLTRGKFHMLGKWCASHNGCTKDERAMAIDDFTHAIQLDPKLADAHEQRALVYTSLKEFDLALADIDDLIKVRPTSNLYAARALLHLQAGSAPDAFDDYTRAIRLEPQNPFAYQQRAELLRDQGHLKEAIADLKAAHDLNPNSAEIQRELADLRSRSQ